MFSHVTQRSVTLAARDIQDIYELRLRRSQVRMKKEKGSIHVVQAMIIMVIWLLLMISGIEPNPGPKKQTTLLTEPTPTGKKSADSELKTMIVQMSSEIRNLGERIDTRLSNIEKRIIEWDQRLLGVEMKLTTCVETSAATNEKVSENVTKLREIEARTDFLEMKLREPNLVFYGVEGEANEGPAETLYMADFNPEEDIHTDKALQLIGIVIMVHGPI
ncbi:hypothetical protein LAZ67_6001664 [Cordylochernes scorpioides]|uniref:Uncharacterized protein n=1 Tax=Cordylochernes scorpioides TaxID=51811 RepID=A0ABY6KKI3_9ARAC|nr:hypothetical protein LAZ67_6001664 [Cordylochernes scorpioides]